ncbi:MAG: M48 family metallopeptidase [Planctomycetota bacterium]
MFTLLLIASCAAVVLPLDAEHWGIGATIATVAAGLFATLALQAWVTSRLLRRVDHHGDGRALGRGLRAASLSRVLLAVVFVTLALISNLGAAVRESVGDLVLVDEVIALLPMLAALVLSWRVQAPLDRRIRDAMLIGNLDRGEPVRPWPGDWRFAFRAFRHHAALVLVPVGLIATWGEAVDRTLSGAAAHVAHLCGVAVVFAFGPWLLRRVWDTVPLEPGPLQEVLAGVGRAHRVRLGAILVWRTLEPVFNAAVLGVLPRLKYVLLSEPLLERLPQPELVAVVAHEVAHAKRHHAVWLAIGTLGCAGTLALIADQGSLLFVPADRPLSEAMSWGLTIAVLLGAAWWFGVMSRVFERQADAFAAAHVSEDPCAVTAQGVLTMSSALTRVTMSNGLRPDRFTFRHGSISTRQRWLRQAVGAPIGRTPADRVARRCVIAASVLGLAGLAGQLV